MQVQHSSAPRLRVRTPSLPPYWGAAPLCAVRKRRTSEVSNDQQSTARWECYRAAPRNGGSRSALMKFLAEMQKPAQKE